MNAPAQKLLNATIRITRVRSKSRRSCIAFGHRVDLSAGLCDRATALVISVPSTIIDPGNISVGGIYEVYGETRSIQHAHGSYIVTETQIAVQDIRLVRPSGSQVIQWIADHVTGIREVKATKLWDAHGERLYDMLDNRDHDAVQSVIPSEHLRSGLFDKWAEDGDSNTLRFVQEHDIPLDLARKVIKFHKKNTTGALTEDPYRLLSFEGSWDRVDSIARAKFGVVLNDPRRLAAALEEALYRVASKGHTCATLKDLLGTVNRLVAPYLAPEAALDEALLRGKTTGQFVTRQAVNGDLFLHAPGAFLMERQCAEFITELLRNLDTPQQLFPADIDAVIDDFESHERTHLGVPSFALNEAQKAAIRTSFENRFSIITGGAGVGKTTVLKALYRVLDTLGRPCFQMALAGRATARMAEATHREAITIAGFLRRVTNKDMGPSPIIVIDEASMLDLVAFHRLVCKLPAGAHLILVGDPYQLPPIGAGLVLHVLCDLPSMPKTELTEVKRQAKGSAIPAAAKAIREGRWPAFSTNTADDVVFIRCSDDQVIPTILKLYEQDRDDTQILAATRSCQFAGVEAINRICHVRYAGHGRHLMAVNPSTGDVEATGFCEGDLLLYTANSWQRNLQNGSLGKLIEVFDKPQNINLGDDENPDIRIGLGRAIYEGVDHYVLDSDVDIIQHAYAITVHKGQGSQFKRVIVPVRKSRVLDRTFIYTATSRAEVQVILVGDIEAVKEAVALPPKAFSRQVGLSQMLIARNKDTAHITPFEPASGDEPCQW
ncbi:AAA family ATPase [Pseudomonas sp. AM14(2022)]|uniref:AAA family ATPase n=1 Tax=Pseudomonas sp. AM14(2022) TaxID=2983371 RepID=UPI002E823EA8|nr:AAA family ATPase [Pseudomonas sp. AM14(2022)]